MKNEKNKTQDVQSLNYELRILQSLRKIIRSIDLHSRKLNSTYDITAPQLITLLALKEKGPLTIASISKEVFLSPSTLVGIIDRLESKGLVERKRSEVDRRQVHISITKAGIELSTKAPSLLQDTLAASLKKLELKQQATISQSLEKIVELIEAKDIDAAPILETGEIERKAS